MPNIEQRLAELEAENTKLKSDLDRVTQNRDSILKEKRALEGRSINDSPAMRAADAYLARQRQAALPSFQTATDVILSREEARNPATYREASERAKRLGVRVLIRDDNAPAQQGPTASPVKYLHDADAGVLYANKALVERVGVHRLQEIAAEKKARLNVFKTVNDLPAHMRAKHARIIDARDPDTLVEGDE